MQRRIFDMNRAYAHISRAQQYVQGPDYLGFRALRPRKRVARIGNDAD